MIVVTGGTGHIGNVLTRKLVEKGETVRVIVPPMEDDLVLRDLGVEIVRADIRDLSALVQAFAGASVVYHLAGLISIVPGKKDLLQDINVTGTRCVVEACCQTGIERLVYTSSVHAFVEPPHGCVITENTEINPEKVKGDYAKSKALATHEVLSGISKGLDAVIVHPSGIIGPYAYRLSNTGQLISQFLSGHFLCYIQGGYDFVDVRDVADGLIRTCAVGRRGENYILSGEWIAVEEIVNLLKKITGKEICTWQAPLWVAKAIIPFAGMYAKLTKVPPLLTEYSLYTLQSNSLFSYAKAANELGYLPRPLKETLADTVEWLVEYKNRQKD